MAPRPQTRRSARTRTLHPPPEQLDKLTTLQKPNLPALEGTPSSRRQYSYGAAIEPPHARPARKGATVNLAAAVKGALTPHGHGPDDVQVLVHPRTRTRQQRRASRMADVREDEDADADELDESEADYRPSPSDVDVDVDDIEGLAFDPVVPVISLGDALPDTDDDDDDEEEQEEEEAEEHDEHDEQHDHDEHDDNDNDLDDARSFGMEDDYYDGATIDSVNGDIPPPLPSSVTTALHSRHAKVSSVVIPSRLGQGLDANKSRNGLANVDLLPFEEDHLDLALQLNPRQPNSHTSRPSRPSRTSVDHALDSRESVALATPPETDSQLSQEAEGALPGPSKPSFLGSLGSLGPRGGLFQAGNSGIMSNPIGDPRRHLQITSRNGRADFFSETTSRMDPDPPPRSTWFSPFRSDRANSVQRDAQTVNPAHARQDNVFHRQRQDSPESTSSEELDYERTDWWQLLNPFPHLRAAWCASRSWLDSVLDPVLHRLSRLSADLPQDYLRTVGSHFIYAIAALVALLTALTLSSVAYDSLPSEMPDAFATPGHFPPISLPSLGQVAGRIGSFIPSLTWPSSKDDDEFAWNEIPGLVEYDDNRRLQKMEQWLRDLHRELRRSRDSGKMHEASIKKLESVVPRLVHMTLKDGKPVVAQEFWHAIRDLIHHDDSFLTLRKQGSEFDFANEKQWRSIVARLAEDPAFASQLDLAVDRAETRITDNITRKLPAFWDSWVASNDNKISQMIGSAVDEIVLPKTPKAIEAHLDELVKKHMKTSPSTGGGGGGGGGGVVVGGVVVTRDEFLDHLQNEFAAHRAEMKAEMGELQPRLEKLVQDSVALTRDELPDGMGRTEVEELVKTLVAKSIADMNLEALARGSIHAHWDRDLKNQVNFFNVGAGAIINPQLSSQTYEPGPDDANLKGLRATRPRAHVSALQPWLDDGDCWCGARRRNDRNNPHDVSLAVMLGHSVIPQHVVVEHILPGATTDPGARPRDLEVYAAIEDPTIRGRVRDFAATHLPLGGRRDGDDDDDDDDDDDWDASPAPLSADFVKIGRFVYEGAELHDGVHVHHLSTELLALGAETDHVVIRATSNYGAKLHTCFYRVRLFGHKVEEPTAGTPAPPSRWRKLWRKQIKLFTTARGR